MVRIAVVDSGINFSHPHVGGPPLGHSVFPGEGYEDVQGHGTCVAAVIRWNAPAAQLDSIRVLPADLRVQARFLASGIDAAVARGAHLINVSMGVSTRDALEVLAVACSEARQAGAVVIAAAPLGRRDVAPAALADVIAVTATLDGPLVSFEDGRWPTWGALGQPRPLPGLARNFSGPSIAAARVTGALARLLVDGEPDPVGALKEAARASRLPFWLV